MTAGGISLHAVDVVSGQAATGMWVTIRRIAPDDVTVAEGTLGTNGMLDHPVAAGEGIVAGVYVASFAIRDFYSPRGIPCPFLDRIDFRFVIDDPGPHVHLPLKFSPWGLALFRGV
jgi:5-hydroxyisourate hydrolase